MNETRTQWFSGFIKRSRSGIYEVVGPYRQVAKLKFDGAMWCRQGNALIGIFLRPWEYSWRSLAFNPKERE